MPTEVVASRTEISDLAIWVRTFQQQIIDHPEDEHACVPDLYPEDDPPPTQHINARLCPEPRPCPEMRPHVWNARIL